MDLYEARMKKRLTQWDLRKGTGIHQSKISLIERGYVIPTQKEQALIANVLGFEVTDIDWQMNHENQGN